MKLPIVITAPGQHITLVEKQDVHKAYSVTGWRTGAFLDPCVGIRCLSQQPLSLEFDGVPAPRGDYLQALVWQLMQSGPVNIGLSNEVSDHLRFVIYFPDERTARRRMDAAVKRVDAQTLVKPGTAGTSTP